MNPARMKTGLLTLNQSKYGKDILEEFNRRKISIDCIFVVPDTTQRKLKLFRRVVQKLDWPNAIILTLLRLIQGFTHSTGTFCYENFSTNTFYFDSVHSKELIQTVQDQAVDLLILGESGIIKEELINSARIGTINAHSGILPYYRGLDPSLWAIFNGDNDKIGSTLHWVDAGIDTGRIIAQKKYDFQGSENIINIEPRMLKDCVSLITDFVEKESTDSPQNFAEQDNAKSSYTFKMPVRYLYETSRKLKILLESKL
jgi:methionyl-tRNA formyltransferase